MEGTQTGTGKSRTRARPLPVLPPPLELPPPAKPLLVPVRSTYQQKHIAEQMGVAKTIQVSSTAFVTLSDSSSKAYVLYITIKHAGKPDVVIHNPDHGDVIVIKCNGITAKVNAGGIMRSGAIHCTTPDLEHILLTNDDLDSIELVSESFSEQAPVWELVSKSIREQASTAVPGAAMSLWPGTSMRL